MFADKFQVRRGCGMAYRIVAERGNETVRMDRSSSLMALAKARVWASEGWEVTIIVRDQEPEIVPPVQTNRRLLACA
jgi:hypothetical protein